MENIVFVTIFKYDTKRQPFSSTVDMYSEKTCLKILYQSQGMDNSPFYKKHNLIFLFGKTFY